MSPRAPHRSSRTEATADPSDWVIGATRGRSVMTSAFALTRTRVWQTNPTGRVIRCVWGCCGGAACRLFVIALLLVALGLATARTASAITPTVFADVNGATGVAVAADGSVFVNDDATFNARFEKYSSSGELLKRVDYGG